MPPRNRGKKAREKREIATRELSIEERAALLDALIEPPLAISHAIMGALAVEHELELSIKSRLRRISQDEWEAMLSDADGPLGNFDRKIKFAKYLGILDSQTRTNLDIIRNVRNKFAHTKRLISFEHSYIADELARVKAPKGFKRQIAKSSRFAPQWRYVSLCLSSIRFMSKKRYGAQSNAHKSRMKRYQVRSSKMGGLFGLLNQPQGIPLSSLSPPKPKTASDPNALAPFGLLSGLLPYFDKEEKK
jgi:hypothetical protein